MVWVLHIGLIALLSWWVFRIYIDSTLRPYFWYGLSAKILAGVGFGWLYQYHFQGGDTWSFFESAKILSGQFSQGPMDYLRLLAGNSMPEQLSIEIGYQGQPRALLMVRLLSVLTLVTGGSYWLCGAYLSLFAFSGLWALVNRIADNDPGSGKAAIGAFIFLPSVLFWSSGVSKETLFIGVLGYLVAWFWPNFKQQNHRKYLYWSLTIPMVLLLFPLKYYYMGVLLTVLMATILQKWLSKPNKSWLMEHGAWMAVFIILILGVSWLHPNLRINNLSDLVKTNALEIIAQTNEEALIVFRDNADPTIWMGINLPWAIVTGLFRPGIGDWGSFLKNLSIIEHLVITIFLVVRVRSLNKEDLLKPDWLPCMVYVLILAGLLTLSTPNFGTLARYKVSFMPVFVFLVLNNNIWWNKLTKSLP